MLPALLALASPAQAENTRVRVPVSALPRQDEPIKIDGKQAVLPDGAREGSAPPKSWRFGSEALDYEVGHCTDGRRAAISATTSNETSTEKVWEKDGKVFLDRTRVQIAEGKVHVTSAERVPVAYVADSVWAYRRGKTVRLITAIDSGIFSRAIFWGCSLDEIAASMPAGTTATSSSPDQVNGVIRQFLDIDDQNKKLGIAPWKGVELTLVASVSKSSADAEPMLNLVIKRP
jgi:hypothetical protein